MDILYSLFFYAIAGVALFSALCVILMPKIVYSALSMVVSFLSIAGLFILLNADFTGLSQVMIYGVGITIIIVFAIMLTGEKHDKKLWMAFAPRTLLSLGLAFALFLIISASVTDNFSRLSENTGFFKVQKPSTVVVETIKKEGTAKLIGNGIFTKYVLPFELLSLLLLAVILGAGVLAKKDYAILTDGKPIDEIDEEMA